MDRLIERPRRLRRTEALRQLVRETWVQPSDLLFPMFVTEESESREIPSMPGIWRYTVDDVCRKVEEVVRVGLKAVMLFGIPLQKDEVGSQAYQPTGVVPRAIGALRKNFGDSLLIVPDVCLCEYTSHGHCGVVKEGEVQNDATLELLARAAVCYAEAGADIVAPSDMMDGRVAAIREALDANGFTQVGIMAYSAKYASGFYGPFREAAGSAPQFGDRRSYQMDPPNLREAMREIALDIREGADIVMVKPGLAYLDVLHVARERFDVPLAVYNVSGEYSLVKAAAMNGWIEEERIVEEILTAFKRAGADIILTYHALDYARRWHKIHGETKL
ncbi:porphobilinogen synthase [Chthonomonas calidirosea]|uniref:Delta-aminolevulinic acid dehydratase n=1 Tax=Chthonomonas calidirosea (strain DSM 23976 / ICMP 18418 / T49) TaxID=1303518 RepID=S0ETL6_CHTCT|nr:porphobilinogen synthase [Chthonomonas calidirosea]CCW34530.1 porphobilinogen synthase [Chthonomonas calidirosea T49]CEK14520.1 porphobilinogen synthase [Chthonomonas calidirosea]